MSPTERFRRWRRYRRTVNELSSMSDRELMDVGISRWDIPTVAAQDRGK